MKWLIVLLLIGVMPSASEKRLIEKESGYVLVEEVDGAVIFHDPILEAEMLEIGVVIPPPFQEKYSNRAYLKPEEEGFFEAFKEFYSPYMYGNDLYSWR